MSLFEQVRELIVEHAGALPSDIHLDTSLFHDLGMDGDDADEFFVEYERAFGVDISELRLTWNRYFGPEAAFNPVLSLWWFATRRVPRLVPITVQDLVASAASRRWIPPNSKPESA